MCSPGWMLYEISKTATKEVQFFYVCNIWKAH